MKEGKNMKERLCDILNAQVQRPKSKELEKTNFTWSFIESMFKNFSKSCKRTEISFTIEKSGIVYFSINSGKEFKSKFTKANVLSCISIAKAHGLGFSKTDLDPEDSTWEGIESFITFSFTPSKITDA